MFNQVEEKMKLIVRDHARKNNIEGLRDLEGRWITNCPGILRVDREYFEELFKAGCNNRFDHVLSLTPHCITPDMNEIIKRSMTDMEVIDALDHMDLKKAPCIDRLSGMFYKENWDVISKGVLHFCNKIVKYSHR